MDLLRKLPESSELTARVQIHFYAENNDYREVTLRKITEMASSNFETTSIVDKVYF